MRSVPLALTMAAGLMTLAGCNQQITTGRGDYMAFCAACHGTNGTGTGEAAAQLDAAPADLTRIAARNGGTYPRGAVMAKIYGYTKTNQHGATMPQFGPLLEGKTVLYDAGDGIQTPTPWRLVALADYIQSIQRTGK